MPLPLLECRSAVMDVLWREGPKGAYGKLCSIGGICHPLSDLFGAIAYLQSHELVKLKPQILIDESLGRVRLQLRVSVTKKLPTLDGVFEGSAGFYDAARAK